MEDGNYHPSTTPIPPTVALTDLFDQIEICLGSKLRHLAKIRAITGILFEEIVSSMMTIPIGMWKSLVC